MEAIIAKHRARTFAVCTSLGYAGPFVIVRLYPADGFHDLPTGTRVRVETTNDHYTYLELRDGFLVRRTSTDLPDTCMIFALPVAEDALRNARMRAGEPMRYDPTTGKLRRYTRGGKLQDVAYYTQEYIDGFAIGALLQDVPDATHVYDALIKSTHEDALRIYLNTGRVP